MLSFFFFYSDKLIIKIDSDSRQFERAPKIYLCGTLWHETKNEMIQILKAIMRMDIDQSARNKARTYFNVHDPDFYEFECKSAAHVSSDLQLVKCVFLEDLVCLAFLAFMCV